MVEMTALEVLHSLPSVVLLPQLLWPMLMSPQHMSLVNVISVNFRVNRMARRQEPNTRKVWRGKSSSSTEEWRGLIRGTSIRMKVFSQGGSFSFACFPH
jgi:hypothetical protein